MRILGLVGSPRRLGNCEVFIKEVFSNLPPGHTLRLIRMPSLRVLPCTACYGCVLDNPCPRRDDDMEFLLEEIASADALLIASPVYYLGAHSIYKQVLDRGFLFFPYLRRTFGKPCVLVSMYGMPGRVGASSHTLRTLASFLGLDIKANMEIEAALPGEVLAGKAGREQAKKAARLLLSGRKGPGGGGCPFCGCEIVRMEKEGFRCALCHGRFVVDGTGRPRKIEGGPIFGDPDHMLRHKAWLRGMKDRFLESRKENLRRVIHLKDVGTWIRD